MAWWVYLLICAGWACAMFGLGWLWKAGAE